MEDYQQEYNEFIDKYKSGVQIDGEEVGKNIAIMAQYFGIRNLMLAGKENLLRKIAAETINSLDTNGKPISAVKSEILVANTPEAREYRLAKVHLENLNQHINSLKSLQKGILNEYSNIGGT